MYRNNSDLWPAMCDHNAADGFNFRLAQYLLHFPLSLAFLRSTARATSKMQYDHHADSNAQSLGDKGQRQHETSDDYPHVSVAGLMAENAALRAELASIQVERSKLAELQRRIMELLHVQSADRLLHDVRNLLNERALLKALAEMSE